MDTFDADAGNAGPAATDSPDVADPGLERLIDPTEPPEPADEAESPRTAPPVVAVMVTNDPGPWFEESLASLGAQDYPTLSVLVLDNASADDPTARIAAALPGAYVRRTAGGGGFADAANEALAAVEGAVFLLFCHDDVVFAPDAVRLMVEEAYRSNAGVVGPKVVDHDRPDVLLEVGMAVDHYGVPFSGIEPGEVDQGQHDGVRDVFHVSHAAMLVRADLFHELRGFDTATAPGADDVDLCWRARLAGARVVVAPAACVGHARPTAGAVRRHRHPAPDELHGATRARIRVLTKAYSGLALVWVLPVAFLLVLVEAFGLVLVGQPRRALALVSGFGAAFRRPGELRRARAAAQRLRCVDDGDLRDLMIRGSARFRRFMIERVHAGDRLADVSTRTRARVDEAARSMRRLPAVLAVILAVLVLFGVRSLLTGHVPRVGSFQTWPGVGDAWATFTGSWRTTMMGAAKPATPAFALIAVASSVLLGHAGLAQALVVGGALPLGAFGAYRLVRPFTSSLLPGVAAAAAYAANPVARNAIWRGDLGALVCFAVAPFVLGAVVRAAGDARGGAATARSRVHLACTLAIVGAVAASVWPPALLLAPVAALAALAAAPFAGGARAAVVAVGVAAASAVVGVLLLAPWSFSLFGGDAASFGARARPAATFGALLHFQTGRAGAGLAPFGILAAAVVPLAIATGPRLVWATRAWMLAAVSFAIAWLPGRLHANAVTLAPEAVLVGAAVGLAFAAGLGVAAVLDDLRQFHFGWRQVMMVVAGAGLAFAVVGLTADTLSGRAGLRADDWASTYSWMADNASAGGFRVLWLGDPSVLPADAQTAGSTGFALTRDGVLDARTQWAAPQQPADRVLGRAIRDASGGATVRLGHLLAPAGVRYVVLVQRAAPNAGPAGGDQRAIGDALMRQLDLSVTNVDATSVVYENEAWIPMRAIVPASATKVRVDDADPIAAATRSDPQGVVGAPGSATRTGAVGPGTLLWSEAADPHWKATASGRHLARRDAFGWTNAFALPAAPAPVAVHFSGGAALAVGRTFALALWVLVIACWFATRERAEAEGPEPVVDIVIATEPVAARIETPVGA